jgi:prevent-host-death family protein
MGMLDLKRDINSLSDFKRNTPKFIQQIKETGEPVVLTVNGRAEIVVQDAGAYQKLLEEIERLYAIEDSKRVHKDIEEGMTVPLAEFEADMRSKEEAPSLAELFAGRVGRFHFGDANLSQESGKKFAALMAEKKRQGRL